MNVPSEGQELLYKNFADTIHIVNENLVTLIIPIILLVFIMRTK
jgi:hypothetical protein